MRSEVLPPETLTPSCNNAAELAREIERIVTKAVGTEVTVFSMELGLGDHDGNDITIKWKMGER